MPGLTNDYVSKLGKKICGKSFLGVFPSCTYPMLNKRLNKFSIIFNTDRHDEKGEHFVAVSCNNSTLYYFDSFGRKCNNKDIKLFIKKNLNGKKYVYNKKCIQDINSTFCGFFCLSFIISLNKNVPFNVFLKKFSLSNLNDNHNIVTKIIIDAI